MKKTSPDLSLRFLGQTGGTNSPQAPSPSPAASRAFRQCFASRTLSLSKLNKSSLLTRHRAADYIFIWDPGRGIPGGPWDPMEGDPIGGNPWDPRVGAHGIPAWTPWTHWPLGTHGPLGSHGLMGPWGPMGPLVTHGPFGPWPLGPSAIFCVPPSGDGLLPFDLPCVVCLSDFERLSMV